MGELGKEVSRGQERVLAGVQADSQLLWGACSGSDGCRWELLRPAGSLRWGAGRRGLLKLCTPVGWARGDRVFSGSECVLGPHTSRVPALRDPPGTWLNCSF